VPAAATPKTTGIAHFMALMGQVMSAEPYKSAPRVFVIVDNGSDHRGKKVAGFWRRGVPAKLGWGVAASGHGPALLATGVLPVRRAGAVTGSRVADGGSVV